MKWLIIVAFLLVQVFNVDLEKAYRIQFPNEKAKADFINFTEEHDLEVWAMDNKMAQLKVPQEFEESIQKNFNAEVIEADVAKAMAASLKENEEAREHYTQQNKRRVRRSPTNTVPFFPSYIQIVTWLKKLATDYSFVTHIVFGRSYEGRNMSWVRVGIPTGKKKPAIIIQGGLHGREWLAISTVVYTIKALVYYARVQNQRIRSLLTTYDFFLLPVANPDGYAFTFTSPEARQWKKTRSPQANNCIGVDANRNFYIGHGDQPQSQLNPCHNKYPGPRPWSEPCTRNISNLAHYLKVVLKVDVKLFYDIHAYGQMYLVPFSVNANVRPPNDNQTRLVANASRMALKEINGRLFQLGAPGQIVYNVPGTALDWFGIFVTNYSYQIQVFPELTNSGIGFLARTSDIEPSGREIFEAIATAAERVSRL